MRRDAVADGRTHDVGVIQTASHLTNKYRHKHTNNFSIRGNMMLIREL